MNVEMGFSRRVHFAIGLAVLTILYTGAVVAIKILVVGQTAPAIP